MLNKDSAPHHSSSATESSLPALVEAMMRPDFYPDRPDRVELVQTHISYVFIAGAFVYKLKKAVRFSFLDCTDPEHRRHLCDEEIRLNRRLAHDLYVGMYPVVAAGAGFALGDESAAHHAIVDHVVKMRRLPAERMLDRMLMRREVDVPTIHKLAAVVENFHGAASSTHAIKYGAASAVWRQVIRELMDTESLVGFTLSAEELHTIDAYCRGFLSSHWKMLNARAEAGRVREGHGDLRAEHICIEAGKISIFDCVEFSERLRTCDLASEAAFLTMDLDRLSARDLADELVSALAESTHDAELPLLMPFYKCYRALIRGVVESLRSRQAEADSVERKSALASAREYFQLAERYATDAAPAIIVVCGLSGSGKSTLAKALQYRLGFPIISSDRTRKQLSSIPAETSAADAYHSGIYAEAVTQATYSAMLDEAQRPLGDGTGVILDATYQDPAHRKALIELASRIGAPILFIECRVDDAEIRRRLVERQKQGRNPSDATVEVYLRQLKDFVALSEVPATSHLIADTARPYGDIVSAVTSALRVH
jgi:aminoglycoside phosphotransferase family enzyme/predicted kinase